MACSTEARAIDFSVEKGGWLALLVAFYSYLKWINNSDKILAGRVISRQVEYQEVYQPQKGDQNYYRFGAFSVERRETKYNYNINWRNYNMFCEKHATQIQNSLPKTVLGDEFACDRKRNSVLCANGLFTAISSIIIIWYLWAIHREKFSVISYVFYVVILFVIQFNSCSCFVRFYDHCIRHNITHFVSMSHSFYPEDQYEYGNLFDKVRFSWPQSGILTWFYSSVSKKNSWAFLRAFEWRMLRLQSWSVEQKSVSANRIQFTIRIGKCDNWKSGHF